MVKIDSQFLVFQNKPWLIQNFVNFRNFSFIIDLKLNIVANCLSTIRWWVDDSEPRAGEKNTARIEAELGIETEVHLRIYAENTGNRGEESKVDQVNSVV